MTLPVVSDIRSAYRWPHDFAGASGLRDALHHVRNRFTAGMLLSTAFSGVCAPTTAIHMLSVAFLLLHDFKLSFQYIFAIDWLAESQCELRVTPVPPQHIFGDIMGFSTASTTRLLQRFGDTPTIDQLEAVLFKRHGALTLACSSCVQHDQQPCSLSATDLHIAGTPCKDFSSQNNNHPGAEFGPGMKYLFVWMGLKLLLIPLIITENVPSFPIRIFETFLPMYAVYSTVLSNTDFGHCVERRRRYTVLCLKTTLTLTRSLSDIVSVLGRVRSSTHTWSEYVVASNDELRQELTWASTRKGSHRITPLALTDHDCFVHALLPWELENLRTAQRHKRGAVYTLSQNADHRKCWSSDDVLHTVIANNHMLFSDVHQRWLTARETLSLQGFPVYREHFEYIGAHDFPLCCFNRSRISIGLPGRKRSSLVRQAGDSMHVSVVGAVIVWASAYSVSSASSCGMSLVPRNPQLTSSARSVIDDDDAGCVSSCSTPSCKFKSSASLGGNSLDADSVQSHTFESALVTLSNRKKRKSSLALQSPRSIGVIDDMSQPSPCVGSLQRGKCSFSEALSVLSSRKSSKR